MYPHENFSAWNFSGTSGGQPPYPPGNATMYPPSCSAYPYIAPGGPYSGFSQPDPYATIPGAMPPDQNTAYGGAGGGNAHFGSAYSQQRVYPPAPTFQQTGLINPPVMGPMDGTSNNLLGGPGFGQTGPFMPVGGMGMTGASTTDTLGTQFNPPQLPSTMGVSGGMPVPGPGQWVAPNVTGAGVQVPNLPNFELGQITPAPQGDIYAPTLRPYPNFDPAQDCERLRKAMKGMGTDEKAIIEIMGHRTADQRARLVVQFKTMYGKDLIKEFKSELSGHFYECVEALCYTLVDFDAMQLRKAVKGAGTDEDALIEILCSRTNEQIRQVKEAYAKMYPGRDLERDVISDTSRHFKRVMVSLLQANRDESLTVDRNAAKRDAEELYRAGEGKLGTDESRFNMILASKSFAHLRMVFKEYETISHNDIEKALKSEMSGDLLKSMLAIVRCIQNKQKYFAYMLMKSMKGLGTKDRTLIRLVVSRCEVDMALIKEEFQRANGKTLESWITDDTTGDYRRLLLALVAG